MDEIKTHVATLIFTARESIGLTQQQLADRIGSTEPRIAQLEDANFEDLSLYTLSRIARALHRRLVISFVADDGRKVA